MHEKSEREVTTAIRTIIKFKAFVVKYKLKAFKSYLLFGCFGLFLFGFFLSVLKSLIYKTDTFVWYILKVFL